jgi:hypothetical protein
MHLNRKHENNLDSTSGSTSHNCRFARERDGKKGESRVVRHDPIGLKDSMPCHWKIFEPTNHSGIMASMDWHVLATQLSILATINSYPGI